MTSIIIIIYEAAIYSITHILTLVSCKNLRVIVTNHNHFKLIRDNKLRCLEALSSKSSTTGLKISPLLPRLSTCSNYLVPLTWDTILKKK